MTPAIGPVLHIQDPECLTAPNDSPKIPYSAYTGDPLVSYGQESYRFQLRAAPLISTVRPVGLVRSAAFAVNLKRCSTTLGKKLACSRCRN
jgi:hypothetical protein